MASVDTLLSDAKKKAEVVSSMRRFEESGIYLVHKELVFWRPWVGFKVSFLFNYLIHFVICVEKGIRQGPSSSYLAVLSHSQACFQSPFHFSLDFACLRRLSQLLPFSREIRSPLFSILPKNIPASKESERHWYCRKSFLTKNWDDFSDENRHRLECHSICWANLHFLGCNYPFTVLAKINEMSYGLPNMSEMLKYADQQVADAACERRMKRRGDFEEKNEKSNTGEINGAKVRRTNEQYPASNLGWVNQSI